MTEREIFLEALEISTPEAREAYLQGACCRDVTLRRKVEELLKEHFSNDSLLAGSALEGERPTMIEPPVQEAPAQMIGRYKLLERIGEGGFGEVWMAEQREPVKRRVALKIIKPGMDSRQIVARFEAERQAVAMMDHPNIARIFDADVTDTGRPYFVMELVRGIRITDYCDQNQLPTRDRLKLFIAVCHAIQHAHQKGIIHRDIKPSNILVTLHDGVAVPKVIDFGIAKATQQELTEKTVFTQFQQFIGTPAYISPEQAEMSGLDIDTRADIYSLGVLLYELLVGQTPFDAKEMMQGGLDALRQIIREKEPLRPSTKLNTLQGNARTTAGKRRQTEVEKLVHQLQGDLDWIVMKCLEKDRTRRYETANGLAMDIQRHLANEPIIARPPSAAYKLLKAWQRNKLVFAAVTAIAAALILGVIGTTMGLFRAEQQRQAAEQKQTEAEAERQRAETEEQRADTQAQQSRRLLYDADMGLAQQSLKENNLGKARRLLDRHRPQQPGEEDLRGWEWRYLWQLTRGSALATLTNRPTPGLSVSFSPDGSRLAVGWYDGHVDLWDVPGRRRIRALTSRGFLHDEENPLAVALKPWVRALTARERTYPARVAFSPVGNLLAATSKPGEVTLYDLDSGKESILWREPDKTVREVRDLAFSQDASRLLIYGGSNPEPGDAVWVVNVASPKIKSSYPTGYSVDAYAVVGAARLSPDNQRLYLAHADCSNYRYNIQCIDLSTGKELWQTEPERDFGLSTLDLSPDGRLLASASAFGDPVIRVRDAATGQLVHRLEGHTSWVSGLAFTRDGRHLISAASDQTIRFWDTGDWTPAKVLRGHTDEIWAVAISEPKRLIATASRDGALMLWSQDGKPATDGYRRLPEGLGHNDVHPLDHSRVLLLPPDQSPALVDLKHDSPPVSLPQVGTSNNVLGCYGTNLLFLWNGTNQILSGELRGTEFVQRGAITLESGMRPTGFTYNPARQVMAWSEGTSRKSVYLASLAAPGRRMELKSDVSRLVPLRFSEDGNYLAAGTREGNVLRTWNVEGGQIVASVNQFYMNACFAANRRVLVVSALHRIGHEIRFYDLDSPGQVPRCFPGSLLASALAVSPNGGLVAASTHSGLVRLFDPAPGELESLRGHLNGTLNIAFSPDGSRLVSTDGGREAVKLWDVGTRQELLNLAGLDATSVNYAARWSADGDVIFVGPLWQAWSAPSFEEIAAAEAKEKAEVKQP